MQFVGAALAIAGVRPALADSHDERFVAGLRQRGLFELAEKYCADRLADADTAADRRATLASELSRTCAEHALAAAPEDRTELWRRARAAADDFVSRNPRDPQLPLVRMQGALAVLAQGELAREEAELAGGAPQELNDARAILRDAIRQLRELDESIAADLQQGGRAARPADGAPLSSAELGSLALHARFQLARGLRNQGLCYPLASADRINSLGQAIELLGALARHELTPPLAWAVTLDQIACLRLVGNFAEAERQLAQAQRAQPPAAIEPRLQAERIRLALARDRLDEALSEAGSPGVKGDVPSADAAIAQLEAYLAAWRQARDAGETDDAQQWEKTAVEQTRAIARALGPASSRRAETMLARSIVASAGSRNPQALVLAAQSLYRSGRLDEALDAYDEAARRAAAAADKNTYFDGQYAAGALEYERGNHAAAQSRLRKLALEMPGHARAADAHLMAVHSAAQLAGQQDPPRLERYKQLLREHVETWSSTPTASQAWYWLGRVAQHEGAWQEAIRALRRVAPEHPQHAEAVAAVGRCYEAALDELRKRGNRNELLAQDATEYLQSVAGTRGKGAAPSDASRAAVVAAARILLKEIPGGGSKAQQLLAAALAADPRAPAEWRRQARSLLVAALAADGKIDQAEKLLAQTPIGTPADALAMVELLAAVSKRAAKDDKPPLAQLELTLIGDALAKGAELDPATVKQLTRRRVETLVDLGQRDEAIAALAALARQYPRDGEIQEQHAQLLTSGGDARSKQAAFTKWREVAAHCRAGSERWFRAHLALARLQLDLGNPAQARATIKMVESSQPAMGGAQMQARFRQLLAECNQASPMAHRAKE
jgi:tetratricopeptide (TPR) repeat protein